MKKNDIREFWAIMLGFLLLKTTGFKTAYVKKIISEKKQLRKERNEKHQHMLDAHHAEYRGWSTERREAPAYDAVREVKLAQEVKRTQEIYGKTKRY